MTINLEDSILKCMIYETSSHEEVDIVTPEKGKFWVCPTFSSNHLIVDKDFSEVSEQRQALRREKRPLRLFSPSHTQDPNHSTRVFGARVVIASRMKKASRRN